jgi:hypothetical protein
VHKYLKSIWSNGGKKKVFVKKIHQKLIHYKNHFFKS